MLDEEEVLEMAKPKKINLDDCGIGLYTAFAQAIMSSDGKYTTTESGTKTLWEEISKNPDCILRIEAGNSDILLYTRPASWLMDNEGVVSSLAINLPVYLGGNGIHTASITLSYSDTPDETTIYCVVTTTQF